MRPSFLAVRRRVPVVVAVLGVLAASLVGVRAPAGADESWGPEVPGEYVVELAPGTNAAAVNAGAGGVAAPERLAAGSPLYRFRLPVAVPVVDGVDRLRQQAGVVAAEPNVAADLPEFFGGRRLFWADLTGPDPTATAAAATVTQPALGHAGLPATGVTPAGVVVAVLDTGLDAAHPAFAGMVVRGYDVVDRDADPSEVADGIDQNGNGEVDEAFGHGTYVAGIVRLVAPSARILPIRIIDTDGRTNAWWLLQGVQRAQARGARVVNLSLGGLNLGQIVARDLEARAAAGLVLVAAAGNEATGDLRYPAAISGVVGVTAIDGATGAPASFANTGSWIDVAAPGVRVVSAFPGGRYAVWGGTSAAAPVVAGALALVAQVSGSTAAVDDLVDRVTATAVADGLDNLSAYGRVDVNAAVTRALG